LTDGDFAQDWIHFLLELLDWYHLFEHLWVAVKDTSRVIGTEAGNAKMIKVANILEEARFGGPQRRVATVAKFLKKYHEIETHVIYPIYKNAVLKRELYRLGVANHSLDITRLSKQWLTLGRYTTMFIPEIYGLVALLRILKPDIVHVNGSYQIKGALAARALGIPVVWHLNDTNMARPVRSIFEIVARLCASGYIVAGEKVRKYYLNDEIVEDKPVAEIHAPVDSEVFSPNSINAGRLFPKPEKNEGEVVVILSLVNVQPQKGLLDVIRVADVLADRENLKFILAGKVNENRRKFSQCIDDMVNKRENIHFIRDVDNVVKTLKSCDIFLFASRAEASPTSVWEAMSMAKPVVSTDVGSVGKHIENGVNGLIVPVKGIFEMASSVERLADDPELRRYLGENARRTAVNDLNLHAAARAHAKIYSCILGKS